MTSAALAQIAATIPDPASAAMKPVAPLHGGAVDALHLCSLQLRLPEADLQVMDWHVLAGEKIALIGRNGAGKTSLIEAVLGLREGTVISGSILGHALTEWHKLPALRTRVGVQLQRTSFPFGVRVSEIVQMHRAIFRRVSAHVPEALGIPALLKHRYEQLSRGERQRVDLFMALTHQPELIFLDEPFSGLDSHFARNCAELLSGRPEATVIMCCHTTDELKLVDRIAWVDRGIKRYEAAVTMVTGLVGKYRMRLHSARPQAIDEAINEVTSRHNVQRVRWTAAGEVAIFGQHDLQDAASQLIRRPDMTVEFGKCGLDDLLAYCATESEACV